MAVFLKSEAILNESISESQLSPEVIESFEEKVTDYAQPKGNYVKRLRKPIIVHRAIPRNAEEGDRYFFQAYPAFKSKIKGQGFAHLEPCDDWSVDHPFLITIPKNFGTLHDKYTDDSGYIDTIGLWDEMIEIGCIKDLTERMLSADTSSPNFKILNNRIICVAPCPPLVDDTKSDGNRNKFWRKERAIDFASNRLSRGYVMHCLKAYGHCNSNGLHGERSSRKKYVSYLSRSAKFFKVTRLVRGKYAGQSRKYVIRLCTDRPTYRIEEK